MIRKGFALTVCMFAGSVLAAGACRIQASAPPGIAPSDVAIKVTWGAFGEPEPEAPRGASWVKKGQWLRTEDGVIGPVPAGKLQVSFCAPGFVAASQDLVLKGSATEKLDIPWTPVRRVVLQFFSEAGVALPGVEVSAKALEDDWAGWPVVSDGDGRVVLPYLPAGEKSSVRAEWDGVEYRVPVPAAENGNDDYRRVVLPAPVPFSVDLQVDDPETEELYVMVTPWDAVSGKACISFWDEGQGTTHYYWGGGSGTWQRSSPVVDLGQVHAGEFRIRIARNSMDGALGKLLLDQHVILGGDSPAPTRIVLGGLRSVELVGFPLTTGKQILRFEKAAPGEQVSSQIQGQGRWAGAIRSTSAEPEGASPVLVFYGAAKLREDKDGYEASWGSENSWSVPVAYFKGAARWICPSAELELHPPRGCTRIRAVGVADPAITAQAGKASDRVFRMLPPGDYSVTYYGNGFEVLSTVTMEAKEVAP